MEFGHFQPQILVLVAIAGAAALTFLCDLLRTNHAKMREIHIELGTRKQEGEKRAGLEVDPASVPPEFLLEAGVATPDGGSGGQRLLVTESTPDNLPPDFPPYRPPAKIRRKRLRGRKARAAAAAVRAMQQGARRNTPWTRKPEWALARRPAYQATRADALPEDSAANVSTTARTTHTAAGGAGKPGSSLAAPPFGPDDSSGRRPSAIQESPAQPTGASRNWGALLAAQRGDGQPEPPPSADGIPNGFAGRHRTQHRETLCSSAAMESGASVLKEAV